MRGDAGVRGCTWRYKGDRGRRGGLRAWRYKGGGVNKGVVERGGGEGRMGER